MPRKNDFNQHSDDYLTLPQAAKLFPGTKPGKRVSTDTVWRWCTRGVCGGVRLRSVMIGGRRFTTRAWLDDFIAARTEATDGPLPIPQVRTPLQQQRVAETASQELDRLWKQRRSLK